MDRDPSETDDTTPMPPTGHDDWPIEGYDEGRREAVYLGTTNPQGERESSTAVVYDTREETIFEADINEEEQRFIPREDTERALKPSKTLGEALENVGKRLGWDSLSDFAQEQLENDDAEDQEAPRPETVTFTQSNVRADADQDMEFTGSYTYRTSDDQVTLVERTFEIKLDNPDKPQKATSNVIERVLRAEEPAEERRKGDADLLEEKETTFEIDLSSIEIDRQIESLVEKRCQEWHESHLEPPV